MGWSVIPQIRHVPHPGQQTSRRRRLRGDQRVVGEWKDRHCTFTNAPSTCPNHSRAKRRRSIVLVSWLTAPPLPSLLPRPQRWSGIITALNDRALAVDFPLAGALRLRIVTLFVLIDWGNW
jgi:hypothetical protein